MKNAVCFCRTIIYWSSSSCTAIPFFATMVNVSELSLYNNIVMFEICVPEKKRAALSLKRSRFFSKFIPDSNYTKQKLLL